ncbi:MAG TPA: cytochrome c [Caulobacteraceae bacterium]|nr:cytochrome c [Caulobacteraceae bacterium]
MVEEGLFDARASTPHDIITAWSTHTTMIHSMKRLAHDVHPPAVFTPQETIAGMHLYERQCMTCHGGPGEGRADWVQGMNPSPPFLLDASRRWSPGQLFWVVQNGVKMTGMPAWGLTNSDGQVWDIVAFLEAMPEMKPADFQRSAKSQDRGNGARKARSSGGVEALRRVELKLTGPAGGSQDGGMAKIAPGQ